MSRPSIPVPVAKAISRSAALVSATAIAALAIASPADAAEDKMSEKAVTVGVIDVVETVLLSG